MGNTADLAMVQKMIIDTLDKRVSHRGSLLKGVAVQGVLYQNRLNAKFTGRNKLGRKMCKSNRDDHLIWAAMSSGIWCWSTVFLKSTVNAAIYHEILEHFMLPSADKLYGDVDFIFQKDLTPAHTAKGTKSCFNDYGVTVLDWPANSSDLNPIENIWGIVKRKMRDTRPNNADDLKAAIKTTWGSITPEQCHRLIDSMPRRIDAVIHAKGGPTKY